MPDNVVNSRLVSAHHTASIWETISTVPKAGEICLETDTLKFKVGDGTHTYAELSYFNEAAAGHETTVSDGEQDHGLGNIKVVKDGTTSWVIPYGLDTLMPKSGGTFTGPITLSGAPTDNLHAATKKYVDDSISGLPTPMQFKGTVGSSGTIEWSALPSPSASNEGYTYKVITKHTTDPICEVGDTIVSNGSSWIVIPSGDEPGGTVTNIATGSGLTGGPITSTGTISHAIPSTVGSDQSIETLKYLDSISFDSFGHVTAVTKGTVPTLSGTQDGVVAHYTGSGTKTNYYLRADGTWGTLPTDKNTYHKSGSWNGTTYTATLVGGTAGTDDLSFTLPDITSSAKGVLKIANTTASGGILASISSGVVTLSHSNTITADSTEGFKTFAFDANGHITSATAITIIDGNFS